MKARLLALAALGAFLGCRDVNPAGELAGPSDPSKIILDGAHGGNKDFWFLPPMVPLPRNNPDFELGKFNNTLGPRLKIEICELNGDHLKTGGLPTELTTCGAIKKTFAPGSVQLVNLPLRQNGWWTLFSLPPDGFYYALWDTRQSNLSVSKYYRVKVFIDGNSAPLGVADVDPMANLFQWKYSLTGEVIQLVDDVMLPITFRVEKGGGSTLCGGATVCASATITNNSPTGSQTVTVDGGAGAIAGVRFPNGWLPASGPQNVVVTVAQVDLGTTNPATGGQANPCHVGLPLQQFAGCFRFTTTPTLAPIDESGRQFATPVTVAVCYVLQGTGDPREKFAELYSSGPGEPPHALEDASDVGLLSPATRNCSTTPIIGAIEGNGLTRFANATWRKMKSGAGTIFGVKTAYAIDLGLGGLLEAFSNVGPALSATIQPVTPTELTLPGGGRIQRFVRLVGSNHHDGEHQNATGIGQLPVTFTITSGPAPSGLGPQDVLGGTASQLTVTTNTYPIDPESPISGGGYAGVSWTLPDNPGTYQLTANGPALGGPLTFTVTVVPSLNFLRTQGFDEFNIAYRGNTNGTGTLGLSEGQVTFSSLLSDEFANAETFPTRIEIDRRSMQADNISIRSVFRDLQRARASLGWAITQTPLFGEGAPSAADLLIYSAFADILVAENWCSGVPTSEMNSSGVMVYGAQQTTQEVLFGALGKFDTAIGSTFENPELAPVRNMANIGRARALLDLNELTGAVAAAATVPTSHRVDIASSELVARQNNGIYNLMNVQRRWTVANQEGGNGLPYRSDADPRTPFTSNGFGFDGITPIFMQQKYPSVTASTPLTQGIEARLIEAEAHMRAGNLAAMTASLNTVRAFQGVAPMTIPASFVEARNAVFKERAYGLWLTSHRLGDLRRLVRQYDLNANQVFPVGDYHKGGVFGTDVNFPIPVDPQFNPTGMACFNRAP